MFAGRLKEKITVYKKKDVVSDYGDQAYELEYKLSTRAGISFANETRQVSNEQLQFPYTLKFYVRFYVPIEDDDIIEWDNKKWYIIEQPFDREKQEKTIYAAELHE